MFLSLLCFCSVLSSNAFTEELPIALAKLTNLTDMWVCIFIKILISFLTQQYKTQTGLDICAVYNNSQFLLVAH